MTAADLPDGNRPLDASEARRAKLLTLLLLNSRSREDLLGHIEHMGIVSREEVPGLYHDCVARLAQWKGLRRIGAIECDSDLDTAFSKAVEGFYAGLMEFLSRGAGSERKMARAKRKALKYTQQRCFVADEETANRAVNSALDLLDTCHGQVPSNWIAEDPERMPAPEPEVVDVAVPVEAPVRPEVSSPEPIAPPVPDNRTSIEKAADRLYGNRLASSAPAAPAAPAPTPVAPPVAGQDPHSDEDDDDAEAAFLPEEAEGGEYQSLLEQATLLRALAGWTRGDIVDELIGHEVFVKSSQARMLIDLVFMKFNDPMRRMELLEPLESEVGRQYAAEIEAALQQKYVLIRELADKGRSDEGLAQDVGAMMDVPASFVNALIDMARDISDTGKEEGAES